MPVEKNQLKAKIIVRNDLAEEWIAKDPILLAGEAGLEKDTNRFKFGDGVKRWSELPYAGTQVKIQGEGEVLTGAEINAAGELVLIYGHLYDTDIIMKNDYIFTEPVGTVTSAMINAGNGSYTKPAANSKMNDFFGSLFAKENNAPKITQPSVSISLSGSGAKEVGTSFTPSYNVTFNKGSYQFGPDTGITATYAVSDSASNTATTESGSFAAITVGDDTNYKVNVTATHTAGTQPKNNFGKETYNNGDADVAVPGKIAAGTKSAVSGSVTGYRNSFWGSVDSKDGTPTSAIIRGLAGKKNGAISAGNTGDAAEAVGAMRVIIAVPAPRTISSIKDVNGLNAEALTAFKKISVNVEGLNGYTAKAYNVYYKDNASACDKANTWHFTVA